MSAFNEEKVLDVHHWTDRLFTFKTTRDASLRFSNGHFTMIGLKVGAKPLLRAYSIVSANYEDHLAYHDLLVEHLPSHEFLGDMVREQLLYYPTVTREAYKNMGRVTELIETGKLFGDLKTSDLDPKEDRIMICGSPGMLKDLKR